MLWRCGRHTLALARPIVMGVLNVTPDSFSDGGDFADPLAAVAHGRKLAEMGAAIVDVGGESTRPGAEPVAPAEELARVRPVVASFAEDGAVPVSIDTRHAVVARGCVYAGASIINDVSGFRDPEMMDVATGCDAGLIVMHMLGDPQLMQHDPRYEDVVAEVVDFLAERVALLTGAGVAPDRIAIDPGIGFGKTLEHNLALLRGVPELAALGRPIVVGASRKRFIGEITGETEPRERLGGSIAAALFAVERGASVLRVHDVRETVQALAVASSLGTSSE